MQQFRTIEEAYDICLTQGYITPTKEIDSDRIKSTLRLIEEELKNVKDHLSKKRWEVVYNSYYNILQQLTDAFLEFDKIRIKNDYCLFTYLCLKHPELELNWDFFQKISLKQETIIKNNLLLKEQDWKEVSLPFNLYINQLKNEIKKN